MYNVNDVLIKLYGVFNHDIIFQYIFYIIMQRTYATSNPGPFGVAAGRERRPW